MDALAWTDPAGLARLPDAKPIGTVEELRALIGEPNALVQSKISDRINEVTKLFVEEAGFLCLATSDAAGNCDVTPRGDPAGFVRILDPQTLLIPERPGNKLADALRNIIANPHVGLLFILPGITDTFRVNGRAWLTTDEALLAPSTVEGRVPKLGIVVHIDEAFTQCSKAFIRSNFWDPERFLDPSSLPTNGEIMAAVLASTDPTFDAAAHDAARAERYARRDGFY